MKCLGLIVISLVLFAAAAGVRAEQTARWKVVCNDDDTTAASRCFLSFFAKGKAGGNGLGIAVQRLHGSHEIQVTSSGEAYSRAEINVQSDTTIVTDYCYGTYCVFVQADELVEQFRKGMHADVRLYNGLGKASVKERVSLQGFTAAHETYLGQIGE
jgi:invasion protein IalB